MNRAIQMTMFHVCNYGAALQTYALQHFINSISGWKCETLNLEPHWNGKWTFEPIVDERASQPSKRPFLVRLLHAPVSVRNRLRQFLWNRNRDRPWREMFARFRSDEIHLTRRYDSKADLLADIPSADLYITGSDQTFNPRFTGGEGTWFFDFLSFSSRSCCRKISYASSFGGGELPAAYDEVFRKGLAGYYALSVREAGGVAIAARLGISAQHCCDPTILLTKDDWSQFAAKSKLKMPKHYILSYNLRYAVDPVPYNEEVERQISKRLNLPIVHLYERTMEKFSVTGRIVRNANLYDFVKMFMGASFVLTSSFHGVVFALISGVPFLAYVNADRGKDCRAYDLLVKCGAERHALEIPCPEFHFGDLQQYESSAFELAGFACFREESAQWLKEQMQRAVDKV